ncbi:MAG: hypothetical protein ACI9PZ_001790 [Parvicella sp.]
MKYFLAVVCACFVVIVAIDKLYIQDFKAGYAGGELSEAFIRDGVLGSILVESGLIGITTETGELDEKGLCAEDEELKGFDFQNQFRLRVSTQASAITVLNIEVSIGEGGQQTTFLRENILTKGDGNHSVVFRAEKGRSLTVKYWIKPTEEVQILSSQIDGRYGKTQAIVFDGELIGSNLLLSDGTNSSKLGLVMNAESPQIVQILEEGVDSDLYKGTFPGKKHKGYCRYVDSKSPRLDTKLDFAKKQLLPRVVIDTEEESLRGPKGILDNKREKGRDWERPALISIHNRSEVVKQRVGLRYHGGTPGRKKNIESFRVVARKSYGKSTIKAEALLGENHGVDIKNLVLKYTYLVKLDDVTEVFNPFVHALALDVGDVVNAIVPRHTLVDLMVNDEQKGLYLAMEQPTERSIENWIGHNKFDLYTYKRGNTKKSRDALFEVVREIRAARGNAALDVLVKYFSIENVINSIMLSAYTGDDDFCQGSELITWEHGKKKITSLNWDLDHAFFKLHLRSGDAWIEPNKYGFRILLPRESICARQKILAFTYAQSESFRTMVRERVEEFLASSLSSTQAIKMLDYYKQLNKAELGNLYDIQISELENYMNLRPEILRTQLKKLEDQVSKLDKYNIKW